MLSEKGETEAAARPGVNGQRLRGGDPCFTTCRKSTRGVSLETGFYSDHVSHSQTEGRDEK